MTTVHFALILITLILGISVTWTNIRGAPWVPTPMKTVHKMLSMANVGPGDLVYDLGCGDGRLLITAARSYGARAVGIELDPLRFVWCQIVITLLGLRGRITVIHGNFFRQDFSSADVVACYLLQETNDILEEKLKNDLEPGTRIVSNTFDFTEFNLIRRDGLVRLYIT